MPETCSPMWKNRQKLFDGLNSIGCDTLVSETPVIPVLIGETQHAVKVGNALFRGNIFAPAIRPPTVPEGQSRIRFSVTAAHTDEDVDSVLRIMNKLEVKSHRSKTRKKSY